MVVRRDWGVGNSDGGRFDTHGEGVTRFSRNDFVGQVSVFQQLASQLLPEDGKEEAVKGCER